MCSRETWQRASTRVERSLGCGKSLSFLYVSLRPVFVLHLLTCLWRVCLIHTLSLQLSVVQPFMPDGLSRFPLRWSTQAAHVSCESFPCVFWSSYTIPVLHCFFAPWAALSPSSYLLSTVRPSAQVRRQWAYKVWLPEIVCTYSLYAV